MTNFFLPVSKSDMKKRGWTQCDFIYICGDGGTHMTILIDADGCPVVDLTLR